MKLSTFLPGIALLAVGAASFGALTACDQPPVSCTLARGDFAVKYTVVEATGDCAIAGEVVGVAGYNDAKEDGNPNLDALTLALRSDTMGGLVERAAASGVTLDGEGQAPNAFGKFDTINPTAGMCRMTTFEPASLQVPALDAVAGPDDDTPGEDATEATNVRYTWKDMSVEVTAAATGTLFNATLTVERDACIVTYKAVGIYPAVSCEGEDGLPDDHLCSPVADLDAGIASGSGINPSYPVVCDPDLLMCVYDTSKPSPQELEE